MAAASVGSARRAGGDGRRLIARPADVLYLELEELKQVATGEWHAGVASGCRQRRGADAGSGRSPAPVPRRFPVVVCPGACEARSIAVTPAGPACCWRRLARGDRRPGLRTFLGFAGACILPGPILVAGMIVARGLGVPAVAGQVEPVIGA